jgi:hypothetical protein
LVLDAHRLIHLQADQLPLGGQPEERNVIWAAMKRLRVLENLVGGNFKTPAASGSACRNLKGEGFDRAVHENAGFNRIVDGAKQAAMDLQDNIAPGCWWKTEQRLVTKFNTNAAGVPICPLIRQLLARRINQLESGEVRRLRLGGFPVNEGINDHHGSLIVDRAGMQAGVGRQFSQTGFLLSGMGGRSSFWQDRVNDHEGEGRAQSAQEDIKKALQVAFALLVTGYDA